MNHLGLQLYKINNGYLVVLPEQIAFPEFTVMAKEMKKQFKPDDILDEISNSVDKELDSVLSVPVLKNHFQFSSWKECSGFLNYIMDDSNK